MGFPGFIYISHSLAIVFVESNDETGVKARRHPMAKDANPKYWATIDLQSFITAAVPEQALPKHWSRSEGLPRQYTLYLLGLLDRFLAMYPRSRLIWCMWYNFPRRNDWIYQCVAQIWNRHPHTSTIWFFLSFIALEGQKILKCRLCLTCQVGRGRNALLGGVLHICCPRQLASQHKKLFLLHEGKMMLAH